RERRLILPGPAGVALLRYQAAAGPGRRPRRQAPAAAVAQAVPAGRAARAGPAAGAAGCPGCPGCRAVRTGQSGPAAACRRRAAGCPGRTPRRPARAQPRAERSTASSSRPPVGEPRANLLRAPWRRCRGAGGVQAAYGPSCNAAVALGLYHPCMPTFRNAAAAALFALLLSACASTRPPVSSRPVADARPSVVLVSIDGFRADYLELGLTPNLQRLAEQGVRAEWMTPSYPTLTFPNHYTLVTGLRPDRHGVVHNTMRDAELGEFRIRDRDAVGNAGWWGGEPIWVGAEKAGLQTAAMFWVGTEAPVAGVRPTRWSQFDAELPANERVDRVLGWLSEPPATRPKLVTLYFEHLDRAGHR